MFTFEKEKQALLETMQRLSGEREAAIAESDSRQHQINEVRTKLYCLMLHYVLHVTSLQHFVIFSKIELL